MYSRIVKQIQFLMDKISRYTLLIIFSAIFTAGVFFKAMYSFDDSPYFTMPDRYDGIAALVAVGIAAVACHKRKWIQKYLNYKLCFVVYMLCAGLLILLVPLQPFSDMEAVYKGALYFSKLHWQEMMQDEYWNVFPGNVKLSVFWGVLLFPLPKTLISCKLLNALFIYVTAVLTGKLAKVCGLCYDKLAYLSLLCFVPLFLYTNQIYFDTTFLMLSVMALYMYIKYQNLLGAAAVLGLAQFLRQNAMIYFAAIVIVYLFQNKEMVADGTWKQKFVKFLVAVLLFFALSKGLSGIVRSQFMNEDVQFYPLWNQIYIGINEDEFGFMDGDFSYDRSFADVVRRIQEYGPRRFCNILFKKTFWLWSQGTYQAQRYAFGNDVENWDEKFEYETIVTGFLLKDGQILRKLCNAFMRAQYGLFFGLMIFAIYRGRKQETFRIFYYIFMAVFLIMLFYELKSRYILSVLPLMAIFAVSTLEETDQ